MNKLFLLAFQIFVLGTLAAQCPGPAQRTNLINLQKSQVVEGTLAGQVPIADDCGNLRYGQYVEIENTPVGFVPTATGNTSNFSEFVIASDSTRWYIDWQGRGYVFGSGGGGPDKNGYYGGNGGNGGDNTIPSVTKSTLTNQLTFYRATDDAGGFVPVRIQVDAGNEPEFLSMKNVSDSLLFSRSDQEFQITSTTGLNLVADDVVALVGDSLQFTGVLTEIGTGQKTFLTIKPASDRVKKQLGINQADLNFTPLTTTLANGKIWVGNASNVATDVTPSGDATMTNTGVVTNVAASGNFHIDALLSFPNTTSLSFGTNQNNVSILNSKCRIQPTANCDLTGISIAGSAQSGRFIIIWNSDSTYTLTLKNESASSTSTNRFAIGSDYKLGPQKTVILQYDNGLLRWRLAGYSTINPIDTLAFSGATLSISTQNDGLPAKTATMPAFTSSTPGAVPASGGGTTNFLRADGTFAAPAGGSSAAEIIPVPPQFPYQPPFDILGVTADSFIVSSSFNLNDYANIPTTITYHVSATGNDANSGLSWAAPLQSVSAALAKADVDSIAIEKGWYFKSISWGASSPTRSINISGDLSRGTGSAVYLTTDIRNLIGVYSPTSNYYSASLTTSPADVFDATSLDIYGDPNRLTKQTSIANVDANPGSWYWAANVIYIRTFDSRAPDASIYYFADDGGVKLQADNKSYYLNNLSLLGRGLDATALTTSGGLKVYAENMSIKLTDDYAVGVTGASEVFLFNVTAANSDSTDLINYHAGSGIVPNIVEYNVKSYNSSAQNSACTNCQASTTHDNINSVRINGRYYRSEGQNIADVSGASSWLLGTNSFNSDGVGDGGYGYYFGTAGTQRNYYLEGVKSSGQPTGDVYGESGNTIAFRENSLSVRGGLATFKDHYSKNSDSGVSSGWDLLGISANRVFKMNSSANYPVNSQLFDNGTSVGLNTVTPQATFHVNKGSVGGGDFSSVLAVGLFEWGVNNGIVGIKSNNANYSQLQFADQYANGRGAIRYYNTLYPAKPNRMSFFTGSALSTARMTIDSSGKVIIGSTEIPESPLHVYVSNAPQTPSSDALLTLEKGTDNAVIQILTGTTRASGIYFGDASGTQDGKIQYFQSAYAGAGGPDHMDFGTASSTKMSLTALGGLNLGTGTFTDAAGVANVLTGFRVNNLAPSGQALIGNGTNFVPTVITVPLSGITAATADNTINNLNFQSTWNYSTATTQTPLTLTANALTTGNIISLSTTNNSINPTTGLFAVRNNGTSTSGALATFQANGTVAESGLNLLNNGNVGIGETNPLEALQIVGNLSLKTDGNKIKIANGTNASNGVATLVAGTVTVSTTAVATGDYVFLTCDTPGGTIGFLSAPSASITNATSFVINSSSILDTSTVRWIIIGH